MRDVVPCSVIPMLIGNNKSSRRLARRLFWRFSVRSHIFDHRSSRILDFMLAAAFSPLPNTEDDEFILLTLDRFASEHSDMTYLLVPCSDEARALVERGRPTLEGGFIIRSPEEMMAASLLDDAPYALPR